jgi:hypothetical protein
MVVPSLTALLTDTPRKMVGNVLPLLGTTIADQLEKELILNFSPGPFNEVWIQNFLPPMEALNISSPFYRFSNFLPRLTLIDPDGFCQLLILCFSPMTFGFRIA